MILKNEYFFWKINYKSLRKDWPYFILNQPNFINTFLIFDDNNKIMKLYEHRFCPRFYDIER